MNADLLSSLFSCKLSINQRYTYSIRWILSITKFKLKLVYFTCAQGHLRKIASVLKPTKNAKSGVAFQHAELRSDPGFAESEQIATAQANVA
jgi:hypothetical protein